MRKEETLTQLQNLAAEFLEGSRVGAAVLDPNHRVLWVSRTFERYFGMARADLLGQDMRQLLYFQLRDVFFDSDNVIRTLLASYAEPDGLSPDPSRRFECRIKAGNQRQDRWLEHWSEPIRSGEHAGGRIDYFYDITDRKQAEASARSSESQLIQAQKMEAVGRLAGGLAHDFNNLLTAINGYTDLILKLSIEDQVERYVSEIRKASHRATDLTSKLLTLSRRQAPAQRVVDLNQLVLDLEGLLRRLIGEDIELVTELDPELGRVWVDPGQLEQAVLNLAINARDAMPTGGHLILQSANIEPGHGPVRKPSLENCVSLSITDNGIGIDPEVREHIFEPFFTTKEADKGTGLGLSTVYAAVSQNQGRIEVDSTPGRGSTFRIYLPVVAGAVEVGPEARPRDVPRHGHERILLVEDDAGVRTLVCELLEHQGYTVDAAEHPAHALELVDRSSREIELLVTDVVMPGMSGPDLANQLVQRFPNMKLLFISGYTDSFILRHGLLDAEHVMLQKPFDARLLAAKVREILDR